MALAFACLVATPVLALDTVTFRIDTTDETLREALQGASLTAAAQAEGRTAPQDVLSAALADYRRLVNVLYRDGRYGGVVRIAVDGREAASVNLLNLPQRIGTVTISVDPGPQFTFGRTEIAPLAPGSTLPDTFTPGAPARSDVIRDSVTGAVQDWRAAGHAKATLAGQSLSANHPARRLNAAIRLAPGPKLRFGTLQLTGDSAVRAERRRKIAGLPEGEVFSPQDLRKVATRLRRTGAFSAVTLSEAETPNPDGTLDIGLEVVDAKPRRFGAGLEVFSREGLTLSGFWLHRNLRGGAERFRVDGVIGQIGGQAGGREGGVDYSIGVRLDRPAALGPDTTGFAFATLKREDEPSYLSDRFEIGLGGTRFITDIREAELALAYTYSDTIDSFGARRFSYLSLPFKTTWDTRNDKLNATSGFFAQAELTPFAGFEGAGSGIRAFAEARLFREARPGLVFAGRLQFGAITGAALSRTPPEYLFFSGGGGTVRGQPYQSLNVTLPTGQEVGGRSFLGLSGEVRADVTDSIGLVGFADAGYIGAEDLLDGSGDWHGGAGVGLRYATGIGPIRLDVAAPVGGDTGKGAQIYVGIGQAF